MFPEGRLFEFIIVGAVALIVVGPKDLPVLMRKVGQFIGRMRAMAAEFRASFDELARQSELDELRKEVEALRSANPLQAAADASGATNVFDDINSEFAETNLQMQPMAAYRHPEPEIAPEPPAAPEPSPPAAEAPAKPTRRRKAVAEAAPAAKPAAKRAPRKAKAGEPVR